MEATRQRAIELKDDLVDSFQQKDKLKWIPKADALLDYLVNEVTDTNTSEKEVTDEAFIILRGVDRNGDPATVDPATCFKEAFAIQLVRDCMYSERIPLTFSSKWDMLALRHTKYIMAAAAAKRGQQWK